MLTIVNDYIASVYADRFEVDAASLDVRVEITHVEDSEAVLTARVGSDTFRVEYDEDADFDMNLDSLAQEIVNS